MRVINQTIVFFVWLLMLATSVSSMAAPNASLWEQWAVSNEASEVEVSHQAWQDILDAYLLSNSTDGVNRFKYGQVTQQDKRKLEQYIKSLSKTDPRQLKQDEQFAYWVNLYNALTVKVVLDEYPVKSIRKIRFLSSLFGPWDKALIKIAGTKITLNDIEHRILRPIWQDPRIHFAVNCASIGCPNLQPTAFTASNFDELLETSTEQFINHPRGIQRKGQVLILSSIFDWYGSDFGDDEEQIMEYFSDFLDDDKQALIDGYDNIEFQYDWALNVEK